MSKEKIVETKSSMGISRSDVEAWVGKGPEHGTQELRELCNELSEGIRDIADKAISNHPECAAFFGLRGKVEIATSVHGDTVDTLAKLGFGPGVDMDYVDDKDNKRACKCDCGNDELMKGLKALAALRKIVDEAADETTSKEGKEDAED